MKTKRIISLLLAVFTLLISLSAAVFAVGNADFSFSSSLPTDGKVSLGDTVTYTVKLNSTSGFGYGTLYFAPSDNLTYVSATLMGENTEAIKAVTGQNEGSYGVLVIGKTVDQPSDSFCTVTFRVTNVGEVSVRFYAYELTDGTQFITPTVTNETVTHAQNALTTPTVTTDALPEAVMGYEYSATLAGSDGDFLTWSVEGELPEGLILSPDGTLSGTPTEFGEFPLVFKASLLGQLVSEGKSLTLSVLEKPRALELESESKYIIDGEYLRKVVERTTLASLLANFKNKEHIKVFDASGTEVTKETALIGTGYTVSLMHGDEKVHTVTVIVLGDVSGNGRVDISDYQRVKMCLFGTLTLTGANYQAALVAGRNNVNISDYQRIKMHLFGTFNIYQ